MVKSKGFTLIEIMIVIAIIGILASMIFPAAETVINNSTSNARIEGTEESHDDSRATIIINGIKHTCDADGDCTPIE